MAQPKSCMQNAHQLVSVLGAILVFDITYVAMISFASVAPLSARPYTVGISDRTATVLYKKCARHRRHVVEGAIY